jgi:F-type H+-transporting ATPase subunit gamma
VQSLRDIRRRIKSVQSTRQIARAMEMVSAARLKRAQSRLLASRPYAEKMEEMVKRVCSAEETCRHPFLVPRDVHALGICVVASDRGLCGAFNYNVLAKAHLLAEEKRGPRVHFLPVGKKATHYFRKTERELLKSFPEIGALVDVSLAKELTGTLTQLYGDGTLDEIWLAYTHFVSSGTRRVVTERLLPIAKEEEMPVGAGFVYISEPPAFELLHTLLPRYIEMKVFMALAESSASEHSARMVAMSFATKNADDMSYELTLQLNRARQSAITKEIADIVGTAEAMR